MTYEERKGKKKETKTPYSPVEHRVKSSDLVDSHPRHLQHFRHGVHNADTRPTIVLPLSEVQERDHGRLLVLRWITTDDFCSDLAVCLVELERDGRVVVVGVSVLDGDTGGRII